MPGQRTLRDITALAMPQSPLDDELAEGDDVTVHTRADRLEAHGWIRDVSQLDSHWQAELTEDGAAILNHFADAIADGSVTERLEEGTGRFVDEALEERTHDHEVTNWEVDSTEGDTLVLSGTCDHCGEELRRRTDIDDTDELVMA